MRGFASSTKSAARDGDATARAPRPDYFHRGGPSGHTPGASARRCRAGARARAHANASATRRRRAAARPSRRAPSSTSTALPVRTVSGAEGDLDDDERARATRAAFADARPAGAEGPDDADGRRTPATTRAPTRWAKWIATGNDVERRARSGRARAGSPGSRGPAFVWRMTAPTRSCRKTAADRHRGDPRDRRAPEGGREADGRARRASAARSRRRSSTVRQKKVCARQRVRHRDRRAAGGRAPSGRRGLPARRPSRAAR